MDKIKVAIFTDKWTRGGIESFIMNICRGIDKENIYIEVFSFLDGTDHYDEELESLGIIKNTIRTAEYISPIKRTLLSISSFGRFLRYMKENNFQIIHINISHGVSLIFAFLSKLFGIRVRIVHSHNSSMGNGSNMFLKKLAHRIGKLLWLGSANYYWTCSDAAAKWLFSNKISSKGPYELIKNGIVTENYRFSLQKRMLLRERLQLSDKFVIGHVGRFISQKNHKFLLKIIRLLVQENENVRLLLVGEGELENDIRQYVKELELEEYVIFFGPTSDVPGTLSAMDLFVLPSFFEGNPVVGIEAQANGLRCIFSDEITRQADITDRVTYIKISEEEDIRKWVDSILLILGNEEDIGCRADYPDQIKKAGYDAAEVAALIGLRYENYAMKAEKGFSSTEIRIGE